jgi:hypothetical protein
VGSDTLQACSSEGRGSPNGCEHEGSGCGAEESVRLASSALLVGVESAASCKALDCCMLELAFVLRFRAWILCLLQASLLYLY